MPIQSHPPAILLVKTSSLGDLIHNLPVVSDLFRQFPQTRIDWIAEESFADIPSLHPAVHTVHTIALRRWKKQPLARQTRAEFLEFKKNLRHTLYDLTLDTQGLIKSAWIARQANAPIAGYDWHSAREPLACLAYQLRFSIPKQQHAVVRNRQLAAAAFGYSLENLPLDYGVQKSPFAAPWLPRDKPFIIFLTATSRDDKLWPLTHWRALGEKLTACGFNILLPAGSAREQERAKKIAADINTAKTTPSAGQAFPLPSLSIKELCALCGHARAAVGVDTGLTHLAGAVGIPTVALYTATEPGLTGVLGAGFFRNLGGAAVIPDIADVLAALSTARVLD